MSNSTRTAQLTVIATYPDGSTRNVTSVAGGTTYTISSPATASISPDGLVTARASGTVVISAINDGAVGLTQLRVVLSGDADGDGLPDDLEIASGLNPNNPVDAEEDPDGDGLTNRDELLRHGTNIRLADTDGDGIRDDEEVVAGQDGFMTSPVLADTDGDGVRDLLEIQTGSNPTSRSSVNLAAALQAFEVSPASFVLTVNTIVGEASRQLAVTGRLRDGTAIDLTSTTRGTVYRSSNLGIANFGSPDGRIFAGTNGTAVVTVSNSTFTATATVTIRTSTPQTLGFVSIPGTANNVDVAGGYAYVAAGSAGLQVVDVSDRRAPRVVASLDTPGTANDVRVSGNLVYVADGSSGLRIINVSNPLAPAQAGAVDTSGDAQDVVLSGSRAYVADGNRGLQVIDVSDPANPRIVGSVSTLGAALGVDVLGNVAVVAEGSAGVQVVDITDPARPVVTGTRSTGDARDVALQGNFAFVADLSSSFTVVDITDRRNPVLRASTPRATGGLLEDVAISGRFALGADIFFVNGIPIIDIANPTNPVPRAILDFGSIRDDNGTGLAVDSSYVYLTANRGDGRLYIGQYLAIEDTFGIAPLVAITAPTNGTTFIEGQTLTVRAEASDDVEVVSVDLLVNGTVFGSDAVAPYEFPFTVPNGVRTVTLSARAVDFGGNATVSSNVVLNILPDPLTSVNGRVVDENGNGVAGVTVRIFGTFTNVTRADGTFTLAGIPTIRGNFTVSALTIITNTTFSGGTLALAPIPGGTVNAGDIVIRPSQNQGREFLVVFQQNYDNRNGMELTLFVSSEEQTLGTVEIPGLVFSTNFTVRPGIVTAIRIPLTAAVGVNNAVARLGVHIVCDRPVSVYGLNRIVTSTDAFAGLPVETFGRRYRAMCYLDEGNDDSLLRSQFAVVAAEDDTTVTITPSATASGRPAGQPYSVRLNRFEVYQLRSSSDGSDLTGSLIVSDKPVGVFSGHACAFVPRSRRACDHLCEQMPPTDTWGQQVLTVPLATRRNGDTFRILADEDGTVVMVNGPSPQTITLSAGQFAERILTGNNIVSANKPILVTQFSNGTTYDDVVSDPFMMLVPPAEQFLRSYTFATPASGFRTNLVNIVAVVADALSGAVILDGAPVPTNRFTVIGNSGFACAKLGIALGSHTINSPQPLGIYVYGFDQADSYGYPGGLALRRRQGAPTPLPVPVLAIKAGDNGELQLTVLAPPDHTCIIEVSLDLVHWTPISTSVGIGAPETFLDSIRATETCRFYRVRME